MTKRQPCEDWQRRGRGVSDDDDDRRLARAFDQAALKSDRQATAAALAFCVFIILSLVFTYLAELNGGVVMPLFNK